MECGWSHTARVKPLIAAWEELKRRNSTGPPEKWKVPSLQISIVRKCTTAETKGGYHQEVNQPYLHSSIAVV